MASKEKYTYLVLFKNELCPAWRVRTPNSILAICELCEKGDSINDSFLVCDGDNEVFLSGTIVYSDEIVNCKIVWKSLEENLKFWKDF